MKSLSIQNPAFLAIKSASATFEDDYTTNTGWTQVGTLLDVDNIVADKVGATAVTSDAERVSKSLGVTLSNTLWYAEFELNVVSQSTDAELLPFLLAAGTAAPASSTQDYCGFDVYELSVIPRFRVHARNGSTNTYGTAINGVYNTLYYFRLTRTSATNLTLSIFTDSARTTHLSGSPQSVTIDSTVDTLTTLIHSGWVAGRTSNFSLDTTRVYNNASP